MSVAINRRLRLAAATLCVRDITADRNRAVAIVIEWAMIT